MTKIYKPTYDEATDRLRVMLIEQLVGKLIAEAKIEYPVRGEGRRDGLTSPSMVRLLPPAWSASSFLVTGG